jgi:hypothetical protein
LTVHLRPNWGKPAVLNFRDGRGNPKLDRARRAPLPYSAQANSDAVRTVGNTNTLDPRSDPLQCNKAPLDADIYSEILKAIDQNVTRNATAYRQTQGRLTW